MAGGDDSGALHKIFDLTRFASIVVLLVHLYGVSRCLWQSGISGWIEIDNFFLSLIASLSFLHGLILPKIVSIVLFVIAAIGADARKEEEQELGSLVWFLCSGLLFYFGAVVFMEQVLLYDALTIGGYLLFVSGALRLGRIINLNLAKDVFNEINETFPQEERLIENEYSVNLPAIYRLKGKYRNSWINIINPFRALLVLGTPGSGKSYFVIRHVITQHIEKGFCFFIYDFKFPDLSVIAYNHLLKNLNAYKVQPKMYFINFDDLTRSHRCNVLYPDSLLDITDATESSRTILLALNREWIKKTGDFFVESPINFTTALFWYLKKYEGGRYCSLPHAIELAQIQYDKLFAVLGTESEIEVLINPFVSAFINKAMEQLEGQIASAKIGLARLASPSLYYVLSGNDFTLDVNNPKAPKLVCMGNNPSKIQTYGAVISLYTERMLKLVNKKDQQKLSIPLDEFPTLYANVDSTIATGRSNKIAITLGVQDLSQLRRDYGKEQADVIMSIPGNIISGQVTGETAKILSERIGKIMQARQSISMGGNGSVTHSAQLDDAIQAAKIANLSSGEFVGAVADDPQNKIVLKSFHCTIQNDHAAIAKNDSGFKPIPQIRKITSEEVMENYHSIKEDIRKLIDIEYKKIQDHPDRKKGATKKQLKQQRTQSL